MLGLLKNILGIGPSVNYASLMEQGAVIIDVRTKSEFDGGHIKGSVNIPLNKLPNELSRFKDKNRHIITCCASGMRSASAKSILKSNGFANVYNGGGWMSLHTKL
jgi:phage shock protein E